MEIILFLLLFVFLVAFIKNGGVLRIVLLGVVAFIILKGLGL